MDIEIFPCSGGLGEGFRRAGVSFDMAIDIDGDHCDSYEENIGHRPLQMDARALLEMLRMGWRTPKPVRLLVADPPCTPWSRAGKRMGTDDPRDMLEGTCQIIALMKPETYLIGNVPGLDDGPNLHVVQRVIGGLSKHGYCTADFARLDAADYGVPQHRVRPWWFGHREGTPCIRWPAPTHGAPELQQTAFIPGTALEPWVTCRKALAHLSLKELGRPIRLRRRSQHSVQEGSVPERPARVVGTSNLSDGNVLLFPDQPRAGKRGRKRDEGRVSQGNRLGDMDQPGATITAKPARKGAGAHATFTLQPPRGGDGGLAGLNTMDAPAHAIVRNTHGNGSIIINDKHAPAELDAPSPTVGSKNRGQSSGVLRVSGKHDAVGADEPSTTLRGGGNGHSAPSLVIEMSERVIGDSQGTRPVHYDDPSPTVTGSQRGGHILVTSKHPASSQDAPANTLRASDGEGANRALEWPWDRPSTTLQGDERVAPPGHHDESFAIRSLPGGVVISELAATILQGFPKFLICDCGRSVHARPWEEHAKSCSTCGKDYEIKQWTFVGKTKKIRWSALGMAMPPTFAHAVASSVVTQLQRTKDTRDEAPRKETQDRELATTSSQAIPKRPKRPGNGHRRDRDQPAGG